MGISTIARLNNITNLEREDSYISGTKAGSIKAVAKIKERYGDDYFKKLGSLGGKKGTTGGFYSNRELARIAGAIGGAKSRRGKAKKGTE